MLMVVAISMHALSAKRPDKTIVILRSASVAAGLLRYDFFGIVQVKRTSIIQRKNSDE